MGQMTTKKLFNGKELHVLGQDFPPKWGKFYSDTTNDLIDGVNELDKKKANESDLQAQIANFAAHENDQRTPKHLTQTQKNNLLALLTNFTAHEADERTPKHLTAQQKSDLLAHLLDKIQHITGKEREEWKQNTADIITIFELLAGGFGSGKVAWSIAGDFAVIQSPTQAELTAVFARAYPNATPANTDIVINRENSNSKYMFDGTEWIDINAFNSKDMNRVNSSNGAGGWNNTDISISDDGRSMNFLRTGWGYVKVSYDSIQVYNSFGVLVMDFTRDGIWHHEIQQLKGSFGVDTIAYNGFPDWNVGKANIRRLCNDGNNDLISISEEFLQRTEGMPPNVKQYFGTRSPHNVQLVIENYIPSDSEFVVWKKVSEFVASEIGKIPPFPDLTNYLHRSAYTSDANVIPYMRRLNISTIDARTSNLPNFLEDVDKTSGILFSTGATDFSFMPTFGMQWLFTSTGRIFNRTYNNELVFSNWREIGDGSSWNGETSAGGATLTPSVLTRAVIREDGKFALLTNTVIGNNGIRAYVNTFGLIIDGSDLLAQISKKQDELESGVNIKTINNQSLLGSGNIEIQGGGGGIVSFSIVINLRTLTQAFNGNQNYVIDINDTRIGNGNGFVWSYAISPQLYGKMSQSNMLWVAKACFAANNRFSCVVRATEYQELAASGDTITFTFIRQ